MIYFGFIILIILQHFIITARNNTERSRKLYICLCGIELFLFLGFRSVSSGYDNLGYAEAFKIAMQSSSWYPNPVPWMEYPFVLIMKSLSLLCTHPQILFLASSAFIVYSGMRLIYKYTTIPWLGVFAWLTFGKIMFEADIMRQSIAYSIVFFGFDFIIKRKFIPFLLAVLTAALFHKSALILVILYPISLIRLNKTNIFIVGMTFVVLLLLAPVIIRLAYIIMPMYSYYADSDIAARSFKFGSLIKMGISMSVFFLGIFALNIRNHSDTKFLDTKEGRIYSVSMILILFSAFSYALSFFSGIFERLAQYFTVFNIIAIPQIFMLLNKSRAKSLLVFITCLLIMSYQIVLVNYRPDWNLFVPYEPFWQNMDCVRTSVYYNRLEYIYRR